jgi:hypothetical protein
MLGLIRKGCMVLEADAGLDTKYVPQRMRCYTLKLGQLYHAKLGHVLSESTMLSPDPFTFLMTNDWSVHHSPQKKERRVYMGHTYSFQSFKTLQGTDINPDIISTTNQRSPSY